MAGYNLGIEDCECSKGPSIDYDRSLPIKCTGEHREVETGAHRDAGAGKGRFDLIPPHPLERLAKHYEAGAEKYGERNWEKGMPLSWYLDSALRHLNKFLAGSRDEDHLAAVAWNVFGYIHTEEKIKNGELPKSLDNMPPTPTG